MELLLVDNSVAGYEHIVAAAKPQVCTVVFDRRTDTHDTLLEKVAALGAPAFNCVGLVQHGSDLAVRYSIVDSVVATVEESLDTWTPFCDFFGALKATYGVTTVDLISCQIYANPAWVFLLNALEKSIGLNFRASSDSTGNLSSGGNWIMESDGIDIRDLYFTQAIETYRGLLYYNYVRRGGYLVNAVNKTSTHVVSASSPVDPLSFIQVSKPAVGIVTWGANNYGGDTNDISDQLVNVTAIASSLGAFAALKTDGTVITWGAALYGGNSTDVSGQLRAGGVVAIASTISAFAALKQNGSVVSWGNPTYNGNYSSVSGQLVSGVVAIASNNNSFAALKSNGSVVTWGLASGGGDSSTVTPLLYDIVAIARTEAAFAAIRSNGSVVTWGLASGGGDSSAVAGKLTSGIQTICASYNSFAALKNDGSVVTWPPASEYGGNSSLVSSQLTSGVIAIASTVYAFAAIKQDGSVVSWGDPRYNGNFADVSGNLTSDVTGVCSNPWAFAAIKTGGTVVTWGDIAFGGSPVTYPELLSSGVVDIAAAREAFAAIKSDTSALAWGNPLYGGNRMFMSGISKVYSTGTAFAAVKTDRTVVAWGDSTAGGNISTKTQAQLVNILAIASNTYAFAALKDLPLLDAPSGIVRTGATYSTITFSWNPVTTATAYDVRLYSDPAFTSLVGTVLDNPTTSATFSMLSSTTMYYVSVIATAPGYNDSQPGYAADSTDIIRSEDRYQCPDIVHAPDTQHYTSGQVLDARKTAALVGTQNTGPKRKKFKNSTDYLTYKKGCMLAAAFGKGRPAAPCAALEDLANFLGTR